MLSSVVIQCDIIVEELSGDRCTVRRKISLKNSRLAAVRDDRNRILLRVTPVEAPKKVIKSFGYPVVQLELFKRFVSQGKATISLPVHLVNLMLSNCPPDRLRLFLATLRTKLHFNKSKRLSCPPDAPPTSISLMDEISPLRLKQPKNGIKESGRNMSETSSKRRTSTPTGTPSPLGQPKKACKPDRTFSHIIGPQNGVSGAAQGELSLQSKVIDLVKRGRNVFCTGGAGTGKSYLIRKIVGNFDNYPSVVKRLVKSALIHCLTRTIPGFHLSPPQGMLPPGYTAVTASTGAAANLIGGTTIHAFSGIGGLLEADFGDKRAGKGVDEALSVWLTQVRQLLAARPLISTRWRQVHHLIIDEVSMLSSRIFERLDLLAREARDPTCGGGKAFGGLQLIVIGDFFQLPPVASTLGGVSFAFESASWRSCRFASVELLHSWRQSADPQLARLLSAVREGRCPSWAERLLKARLVEADRDSRRNSHRPGLLPTRLCTHRHDADLFNAEMLASLPGTSKTFRAADSEPGSVLLDAICPAPKTLSLKVGAQVILLRNIDTSRGLVNGARGVVEQLSGHGMPEVRFFLPGSPNGLVHIVQRQKWGLVSTGALATQAATASKVVRSQLPLSLAWAISIHKSQGITLDSAELDLSKVFECGQAYVALSRCRTLASIRLLDWEAGVIRSDPRVVKFYSDLRQRAPGNAPATDLFVEEPGLFGDFCPSPIKRAK